MRIGPGHPHPFATATRETTSWHLWHAAVIDVAGVTHEEYEPHRERASRAYTLGEAVWMFAGTLAHLVAYGRKYAKADAEEAALRRAIALGRDPS